ncbi:MAG TPA: GIY-YIG nuclease family protein [Candidatus Limnocylindrales bacterium]|nr:GIY-YIG nuclease family protein [Candidatus Limnocylindrales bacterium]
MAVIYGLYCPIAKCIRYIGKAKDAVARFNEHLEFAAKSPEHHHLSNWIRKLDANKARPVLKILYEIPAGDDWRDAERRLIKEYRAAGHLLTNMTSGGDGNHDMHPESLARMSVSIKEAYKVLPNYRQQNSEARKAEWARRKADDGSLQMHSAKISKSMKALWSDPKAKAARLATLHTPEAKAKRYGKRDTPENTAKRVAKLKAAWSDPQARAARIAQMQTPAAIAKRAAATKEMWRRKREAAERSTEPA